MPNSIPATTSTKYPFILTTVATRKAGTTRSAFYTHNETIYAPLLQKAAGKVHPLSWNRQYHVDDAECPTGLSRALIGGSADEGMDWDCMGEMVFEDELHLQQFITFMHSDDALEVLAEEEKFVELGLTKLVVMRRGVSERKV